MTNAYDSSTISATAVVEALHEHGITHAAPTLPPEGRGRALCGGGWRGALRLVECGCRDRSCFGLKSDQRRAT